MTGVIFVEEMATLDGRDPETAARVASWLASGRSYRCRQYSLGTATPEGWRR